MEEIAQILPRVLRRQPLRNREPVLEVLVPLWPRVAGKLIARFSQPVTYHQGILTVAVSSSPWATELREMKEEIRGQINHFLGAPLVKKLRVVRQSSLNLEQNTPSPLPEAHSAARPEAMNLQLPWAEDETPLDPEIARIVERSFRKYFSRDGKEHGGWS